MIIRDYLCEKCGDIRLDVIAEMGDHFKKMLCDECRCHTRHEAVCNGGVGKRYRCQDWSSDPRDYREFISTGVEGYEGGYPEESKDSTPIKFSGSDKIIHESDKFVGDTLKEKRERRYHAQDVQRGYVPIFCDMKKQQRA